ncbi:MAG: transposon-encoded TnpW family protein [Christensenellaceae bacterium]|jgi:hypothetical protein|nr:transposon-encoded TnpW family protein [Christensenellaceae bacterium]
MQTVQNSAATTPDTEREEPRKLLKRIGSTLYEVTVYFSESAKETMEDKCLRLMKSEVC